MITADTQWYPTTVVFQLGGSNWLQGRALLFLLVEDYERAK
jgi:hypothetical protein